LGWRLLLLGERREADKERRAVKKDHLYVLAECAVER
jgi:hypothetical protein